MCVTYGWTEFEKELRVEFAHAESMAGNREYHQCPVLYAISSGSIPLVDAFLDAGLDVDLKPYEENDFFQSVRECSIDLFAHLIAKLKAVHATVILEGMTVAATACRPDLMRKMVTSQRVPAQGLQFMLKNLEARELPNHAVKTLIQNFPNEFWGVTDMRLVISRWKLEWIEFVVSHMADTRSKPTFMRWLRALGTCRKAWES